MRNVLTGMSIGATKVKLAAPKSKYIEHLLMATQVRSRGMRNLTTLGGSS